MSGKLRGAIEWGGSGDEQGNRDYYIEWLVQTTNPLDGPFVVRQTPGLPLIGSIWQFGRDSDPEAFCKADWSIEPVTTNEPGDFWKVRQNYTTKPYTSEDTNNPLQHPLLAPPKLSGSFIKYVKEIGFDRYGNILKNSAHEPFRGKMVEFDYNRPQVIIEKNYSYLNLPLYAALVDTLDGIGLWGLPPRCIKLSNVSWSKAFYAQIQVFYPIRFEFDIDFNTFDRYLPNIGTACLAGWSPGTIEQTPVNPFDSAGVTPNGQTVFTYQDPTYFEVYKTKAGENKTIALDSFGKPKTSGDIYAGNPVDFFKLEHYADANYTLLDIPLILA